MVEFIGALLFQYKYWILFPAAFVFGPIVALTAGLFVRLEYIELVPTFIIIVGAMIIGDIMWYWIGHRWGEAFASRFGKYVGITASHVEYAKRLFHEYHTGILFISKVTSGLGFAIAILFTAGLSRVPFYRFVVVNAIGETIWSGGLLAVGFFFSNWYLSVNTALERASVVGATLIFFTCLLGFGVYMRKRFVSKYEDTNVI